MTRRLILLLMIVLLMAAIERRVSPTVEEPAQRTWTVTDSKSYAKDSLYVWADKQFRCLEKLWAKESHWRPNAYNKTKVMGKNAGGIPQLLGMSPDTPAPTQIDRGLAYIKYRYTTPCKAWAFHQANGWY